MIAIEIERPGSPEVLVAVERPLPEPGTAEIRMRVKAAGVSRADTLQRQGKYPPPPGASDIPGLDAAGIVDAVGSSVTEFKVGDEICAILAGGGYAEYCAVPVAQVLSKPEGWTFEEAATLPENLFTVYDNLVTRAGVKAGETVLIHGGSSGIGSMAIMLIRLLQGNAIVTAGSDAKCSACLSLGAEAAINYRTDDFVRAVQDKTNGRGVDVLLDLVGGPYLDKNLQVLALEGRLVIIGMQGGMKAEINLGMLLAKRLRIIGSSMRSRTPQQKGAVAQKLLSEIWPELPSKKYIRPVIDRTFPLADAWRAHERMETGEHIGKIVLVP